MGGLVLYDGEDWTVYNTHSSDIPQNPVMEIVRDESGNWWIGTYGGGLAKFDGTDWIVYNTGNSGLPENRIHAIAIDGYGNKWIGTHGSIWSGGLTKFDGSDWTNYNTFNSGLPWNNVRTIAIDKDENVWVGTDFGLGVYTANGHQGEIVIVDSLGTGIPETFSMSQNYPNPFNPSTNIDFSLPSAMHVKLTIYDQLGRRMATLVDRYLEAGYYNETFDASHLPSGVYFYRLEAGGMSEVKKMIYLQ